MRCIRTYNEGILGYTQYPFNQPDYKERAQRMLDIFVPFLEAHSELTAEEQRIFDDFKAQHPIRTYDDVEKAQGTFKIYQLPSGEKYHGMERTRKSLQKQLDKLEKAGQDDTLTFEQLGIDRLFVDEAHEFKNLFVATNVNTIYRRFCFY